MQHRPEVLTVRADDVEFGDFVEEGRMVFLVEIMRRRGTVNLYLGQPGVRHDQLSITTGTARISTHTADESVRVMRGVPTEGNRVGWAMRVVHVDV